MLNPETLLYRVTEMTIKENIKVKPAGYVRLNWGAPFIISYMMLLLSAAVFLLVGASSLAETLTNDSFYLLVTGIILQLLCFIKYEKTEQLGTT
jgi:hypothetical protein